MAIASDQFQAALAHHQAGRLDKADELYRIVLSQNSQHTDALHYRGVIAHQRGNNQLALELIHRAIQLAPNNAQAYGNLGSVLRATGQASAAIEAFNRAMAIAPEVAQGHFNLGTALLEQGDPKAIAVFQRAIALAPNYCAAHTNLGNAFKKFNRHNEAIVAYRAALQIDPNFLEARYNLAVALQETGDLSSAIADYRKAVSVQPDHALAWNNLGNALSEKGQWAESIAAFERAISIKPDWAQPPYNLGIVLRKSGKPQEAVVAYQRSLELSPADPQVLNNLGNALKESGRSSEAKAAYQGAVAARPDYAEAHDNLGVILREEGRLHEAIDAHHRAIALKPDLVSAHINLGNALIETLDVQGAISAFTKATELAPHDAAAFSNLGNALRDLGQLDDAMDAYRQAISLQPGLSDAWNNLGNALKDGGNIREAILAYRKAMTLRPEDPRAFSNVVYAMHFDSECDAYAIAEACREWNARHARHLFRRTASHIGHRAADGRIRIGYLSPDFRDHVVGKSLLPLFLNHNRNEFSLTCYAHVILPDSITSKYESNCDRWRNIVGLSDKEVARQIEADGIDVLVDLTLHMGGNRLLVFAEQPAPVQVTYLGYCGSTGLEAMQYRLSDPHMDPIESDDSIYSEKTVRLPQTYWCYRPAEPVDLPPSPNQASEVITFGCLNNFAKVSTDALEAWTRILQAVPDSRLTLHAVAGRHRERVVTLFQHAGISPDRLSFVGKQSWSDYMRTHGQIDIALDPFPYAGGVTSCDALWMGASLVTLSGKTAVGRGGRSILSNIGMSELIAYSTDQYVKLAVDLAHDLPRLRQYRDGLRERMKASPLMDEARFARDVEAAYRGMLQAVRS